MVGHPPAQRLPQLRDLRPQPPPGQVGQPLRVVLARRSWPSSMARPETPRTSVATLASLMLASSSTFWMRLATAARSADQLGPLPGQVAQLADRRRRDEAGREQAVLEQLGDPLGSP